MCVLLPQELTLEVGDWRKNVEAMSGMKGRKKMFDAWCPGVNGNNEEKKN